MVNETKLPLQGITAVAVEQAVAAPFASRQLADLGARVIKIERPGVGDFARDYDDRVNGLASYFVWANRSKESLTLDLKHPEGAAVLRQLVARADVFLHNLAPGAMDRLGFGAAALRAAHSRLVVCEVSGYGASGPYRDRKAYDLLVQSESGLVSITGTPETPSKVGISIADIAAAMYAFSSIVVALLRREQTGEGATIETSMFEALGEWMGHAACYASGGTAPSRTGASHATIAPYGPFTAADGRTIVFGLQNDREWARFCGDVLGRPDIASDPRFESNVRRVEHREALDDAIAAALRSLTAEEVTARLDAAQIAHARMNSMHEFLAHPQLEARERWRRIESPCGPLPALLPPFNIEGLDPRMGAVPAVGEHTDAILEELGYDRAAVAGWRKRGIV